MKFLALLAAVAVADVVITPPNPHFVYDGRFDLADPTQPAFGWANSGFRIAFENSTFVKVAIEDWTSTGWFRIWIDGSEVYSGANTEFSFQQAVFDGSRQTHVLRVAKRNEIVSGSHVIVSVTLSDGAATVPLPAEEVHKRKVEFIGDSISCGYGVLGDSTCHYSLDTADATYAYGELVAQHFGADLHLACMSGYGIWRNYGDEGESPTPLPYYYKYTTSETHGALWNMSSYHPEAIVINLGTNDYSYPSSGSPSDDQFITAWVSFVKQLITYHPDTHIFATTSSLTTACRNNVQTACAQFGDKCTYFALEVWDTETEGGCDGHPNRYGEEKMAQVAISSISSVLGW